MDDQSHEETVSILERVVRHDQRCKLIRSGVREEDRYKTTRYATCINLAIPHVTGDLVTYLTDDDIYYPERFEKMAEVFEKCSHIHVVYGKQQVVHLKNEAISKQYIRPLVGVTRNPMRRVDHNSFMHRRSCLDKVGGWNDHPSLWRRGDIGFFQKLVHYWDFHPVDFLTDEHRIHDKGIQSKLNRGKKPWAEQDAE